MSARNKFPVRLVALAIAALALSSSAFAGSVYSYRVLASGVKGAPPAAVSFTFGTCGAAGATGPSLGQCNSAYSGTSLSGAVGVSGGIQTWTVPASGVYTVTLAGAAGGGSTAGFGGGLGAILVTQLTMTAGTAVQVLVGQMGASAIYEGAGGGATYIAAAGAPLAVAGGGGGGNYNGGVRAANASTTEALTNNTSWAGNANGYSSGAGFWTDGSSKPHPTYGGFGTARSFLVGGTGGGALDSYAHVTTAGGFGGGGGAGYANGGSGGGYSASLLGSGNGGNSFSSGTVTSAQATNAGAGSVTFLKN